MVEPARQLRLRGLGGHEPIRVWTDYGPVGEGASKAHHVLCENNTEYLTKGPTYTPDHPHVAANELIAAELGNHLGLPMLDFRPVRLHDDLFFASQWMPPGTWHQFITPELFDSCVNRDVLYPLVVFDPWICNVDRHELNLLARTDSRSRQTFLVCNDHSHSFVLPGRTATDLALLTAMNAAPYFNMQWLRERVVDRPLLEGAISSAEAVSDQDIKTIVGMVPRPLLSTADAQRYIELLVQRRDRLRSLLLEAPTLFPNLGGTSA